MLPADREGDIASSEEGNENSAYSGRHPGVAFGSIIRVYIGAQLRQEAVRKDIHSCQGSHDMKLHKNAWRVSRHKSQYDSVEIGLQEYLSL